MGLSIPPHYRSFLSRFYQLAVVSALSNMMVPLAGLFDTAFLGHLDDIRHLAGVILGSVLFDYLYRILKFFRNSTNAITAQAEGQKNHQEVLLAGLRSSMVAIAVAILILLLQYPLQRLGFAVLSGSPEIEAAGLDYFNARIWGAPAVLLNFVLIGWFLGREMNRIVLIISLVGNGSNVLLDYLMINRWGWDSMGAGLATALSQYLALGVALVAVVSSIEWASVPAALKQVWDVAAFKSTLLLKSNILIRFVALISAYAIFTNLSATLGTTVLAENGLLLQIALLSQFTVNGVGLTTQTLVGNFKGQGESELMMPILYTSIVHGLLISLPFAVLSVLFPVTVFGLLTSHTEVSYSIHTYVIWLVPLLSLTAVAFVLEGYFIGLKEGAILRNSALTALGIGYAPIAIAGWYYQSNHLLWASLTVYMATLTFSLSLQILKNQQIFQSSLSRT